jgi:hypothetical protein
MRLTGEIPAVLSPTIGEAVLPRHGLNALTISDSFELSASVPLESVAHTTITPRSTRPHKRGTNRPAQTLCVRTPRRRLAEPTKRPRGSEAFTAVEVKSRRRLGSQPRRASTRRCCTRQDDLGSDKWS